MTSIADSDLQELQDAAARLQQYSLELLEEWKAPLTLQPREAGSVVARGVLWVKGPLVPLLYHKPKRQQKPKHACPECGAMHARRGVCDESLRSP